MLKLAGVILAGFAILGLVMSAESEFINRQKQLRNLAVLLSFFHNQICVLCLPLPLVIEEAIRQMSHPYSEICRVFSAGLEKKSGEEIRILWKDSCIDQKRNFALSKEEWLIVLEIGDILSDGTIEFRKQLFSLLQQRVAFMQTELSGSLAEKRKITRFGIVASGIFLIVLLI